jgi:hypothetical protein
MITTLIVLIPLLIISLLFFFKLPPKNIALKKIKMYNLSTIVVAILLSVAFSLRVRTIMINGSDAAWWPIIAFTLSLAVLAGTISISGILRNLIIFRDKNR